MNKFYYYETSTHNPYYNLALEEYLLDTIAPSSNIFYLWQNENSVIIGKNQDVHSECHLSLMKEDHVHLVRRSSGGGAVYHDLGNLNFTFIMNASLYDVKRLLGVIVQALKRLGISANLSGRNDIVVDGQKVSGNAFMKRKNHHLAHGTLLMDVDMQKLGQYLNVHPLKLKHHKTHSVTSRVVNLKSLCPLELADMKNALKESFEETFDCILEPYQPFLDHDQIAMYVQKYQSEAFIFGQSLKGAYETSVYTSLGLFKFVYNYHNRFEDIQICSDGLDLDLHEQLIAYLKHKALQDVDFTQLGFDAQDAVNMKTCMEESVNARI